MPRLFRLWHQYQNYHLHPVVEKRAHAIGGMHARTYARRLHQLGCLLFAQRGHLPEEVLARRPLSFHNDGIAGGNGLPGGRGSGAQRRLGHLQQHRALVGDLGTAGQLQPVRRGVLQILIRKRESMKHYNRLWRHISCNNRPLAPHSIERYFTTFRLDLNEYRYVFKLWLTSELRLIAKRSTICATTYSKHHKSFPNI